MNKFRNLKQLKKTLVLQHDQSDCGVACLLSLVQFYGGTNSLENLRRLSGTDRQGTTLLGLYQSAKKIGFSAQGNEATIEQLIEHGEPTILHVLIEEKLQHYVVCYAYENHRFVIGDPAKGVSLYSREELKQIWKSGICLTLRPNENFVTRKTDTKTRKQWLFRLIEEDRRLLVGSVILGMAIAVLGMAMAVFSQKLIDTILPAKDLKKLLTGVTLLFILLLVRTFFSALRDFLLIRQTKDFNNRIIDSFYSSLLNLPKLFFDTRKIGELVARLNDTQRIQRVISAIASGTVISLLVALISIVFLLYYSWQTGLIALLSLPVYFALLYRFNSKIIKAQKEVMQGYALSESHYISSMQGVATIKNANKQRVFQKLNQLIYGKFQNKVYNLGKLHVRLSLFSELFSVLFLVGILGYTSLKVYNEELLLGELMAILSIAGSLLPAVANLALIAIPINEAKVAFNRMYEFASVEKEETGECVIEDFESLQVQRLSFRFAGRSLLLKDISLHIDKNECLAIVGENGCGKSTLGQILQKFYPYESGKILVNNNLDLQKVNTESWRNLIGVIPQDITLFNGSVIDNIVMGAECTSENLLAFLKKYDFDFFINQLPQGFATILGEEGINLSGGQKQMIALMRALYQKPKILLLDEFTSAMDRKTEQFVLELLQKLKEETTIIFISHRLHSLKKIADKIAIVNDGVITSIGTHSDLMQSNNFYSSYWKV